MSQIASKNWPIKKSHYEKLRWIEIQFPHTEPNKQNYLTP